MNFDQAFEKLMGYEGGYSDNPNDPGGETMYGVTKSVAVAFGYMGAMKDLPVEIAKQIYWTRYWSKIQGDQLPDSIRYAVFDAAVNSGAGQAVKWLQRAIGETDDGILGPKTLATANALNPDGILRRMLAQRLIFMTSLANWPTFSKGWARRIGGLLAG